MKIFIICRLLACNCCLVVTYLSRLVEFSALKVKSDNEAVIEKAARPHLEDS